MDWTQCFHQNVEGSRGASEEGGQWWTPTQQNQLDTVTEQWTMDGGNEARQLVCKS